MDKCLLPFICYINTYPLIFLRFFLLLEFTVVNLSALRNPYMVVTRGRVLKLPRVKTLKIIEEELNKFKSGVSININE